MQLVASHNIINIYCIHDLQWLPSSVVSVKCWVLFALYKRGKSRRYKVRSSHRDSFRKYLLFFSRSNIFIIFQEGLFVPWADMNFPGGTICSSNRHEFSRSILYSKRHVFSRRFYLFVEQTLLSHRTDTNFPRNAYLVLEHIKIFQEPLFSHRTDTHFPGSPIKSSNTYEFPGDPI